MKEFLLVPYQVTIPTDARPSLINEPDQSLWHRDVLPLCAKPVSKIGETVTLMRDTMTMTMLTL